MLRTSLALLSVLALGLVACDNVGRAWDPDVEPNDPTPTTGPSSIEVVPLGGDTRDGRPKVKATFPTGGGWPLSVPVVVEFSESINEAFLLPSSNTATDAKVILRVKGTTQALPCQYDLLADGRLLVLRPSVPLSNGSSYEVVLLPDSRDVDGVRFDVVEGGEVLAEFQANQDEAITDGRILTTFPRTNARDVPRETAYYVVFDRPANAASIRPTNFFLRTAAGVVVAGDRARPLELLTAGEDLRVLRFTPAAPLLASTRYELVVDATITFGDDGVLDFRGRTPFAVFDTNGPQAPTLVELANPTAGFPNMVNRAIVDTVALQVTTAADAEAGDRIVARIYGGDAGTTATGDLLFVERSTTLPAAGAQTVSIDFTGQVGSLSRAKFDDGVLTFAVQTRRGSQQSGYARHASSAQPRYDLTAPSVTVVGPPGATPGTDLYTDQEYLAFYGTASEQVADATFTDGVNAAVGMFAASSDGRFVLRPVPLGRLSAPRAYSLLVTDLAGNLAVAPTTGNIVQRGLVTGTVAGTLTVEAYDHATLQPIAGATVLVDPGVPTVPATGQLVGTTGSDGRAEFTGLAGNQHTVTIVRAGYDLVTLYATGSARVSLPLRPLTNATATLQGQIGFQQPAGVTALVGHSAFDDPLVLAVATTSTAPRTIPDTAIMPNRPQVLTAFGGAFEPTATPAFSQLGYQMLGATLLTPTPPAAPAAPGGTSQQNFAVVASSISIASLTAAYNVNFALATGLDTANLVGGKPTVRATMSMQGFGGQVLNGVGFASLNSGAEYATNASYGLPASLNLGAFSPVVWFVSQAQDTGGRVSRHRALLSSFLGLPVVLNNLTPPAIPVVAAPGGPFTGSPSVSVDDAIDPAVQAGALGLVEVAARDAAGRGWRVLVVDGDAVGGADVVQFPDLATASVAGLQAGSWSVRAEARLFLSLTGATGNDLVLAEKLRQELTYARSAAVTFTIQ